MSGVHALPACRPAFPVRAPHLVRAAPQRLGDGPVIEVDDRWPSDTAHRLGLLRTAPQMVRVMPDDVSAGLIAALEHAVALAGAPPMELPGVAEHLASLPPALRLVDAAVLHQPADLVVLRRSGQGELVAELLAVAFPSGWSPSARRGSTLAQLHTPVAHNERLQAAAPALSEALLTKGPFLQHVWGLQPDEVLSRAPPAGAPARDGAVRWWLRVERQTTVPLPGLERALFYIRPTLTALADLSDQQRMTLAASVRSMDEETLAYKGLLGADQDNVLATLADQSRP